VRRSVPAVKGRQDQYPNSLFDFSFPPRWSAGFEWRKPERCSRGSVRKSFSAINLRHMTRRKRFAKFPIAFEIPPAFSTRLLASVMCNDSLSESLRIKFPIPKVVCGRSNLSNVTAEAIESKQKPRRGNTTRLGKTGVTRILRASAVPAGEWSRAGHKKVRSEQTELGCGPDCLGRGA